MMFGFLCLLGTIDYSYCLRQANSFWSPSITVETLSVDFGNVSATDDVHREITVKNVGRSPLIIERVRPSCASCIVIQSYPKEPIPLGKQGKIEFSLDLSKRHDIIETSFAIVSNAEPQKVVVVKVTANVLTEDKENFHVVE